LARHLTGGQSAAVSDSLPSNRQAEAVVFTSAS
jgi:hypothetical protein